MPSIDVAVVGAGVFGSWTALWLRRAGKSVLLLDAWGPGHARASSGGESRIFRRGYGPDWLYTDMAERSLPLWQEIFGKTEPPLFHKTGVLWIAREDDEYVKRTREIFAAAKIKFEILEAPELARRYPQIQVREPNVFGMLERESGAIMARRAVVKVVEAADELGVQFARADVRLELGRGFEPSLKTKSGESIVAGQLVFACGPWLPKLFPDLLGSRIFPTRQEILFFAPPAGNTEFAPGRFPTWIDFTDARVPYGFPDIESRGLKVAFDRHGPEFDPDSDDRLVSSASIDEARGFLAERFPALREARLAETRVCQYENTSNGDFLIDRHPDFESVWLVGGGSGHGFKHGPAVGEYAANLIVGKGTAEERFSYRTKGVVQNRTVF